MLKIAFISLLKGWFYPHKYLKFGILATKIVKLCLKGLAIAADKNIITDCCEVTKQYGQMQRR